MVCCLELVNIYEEFCSELFLEGQYVKLFGKSICFKMLQYVLTQFYYVNTQYNPGCKGGIVWMWGDAGD